MKRFSGIITSGSASGRNRPTPNMDKAEKKDQHRSMQWTFLALTAVIGCVGASGLLLDNTDDLIQGQAEAVEYCISSKTTGRILNLYVHEGDHVNAGDTVATLSVLHINGQPFQTNTTATEIRSYINKTVLTAPKSGEVAEIYPRPGDAIDTGAPVMSIIQLDDVCAVFNMREDQLGALAVGKEFTAFLPAFNRDIALRVTRLKSLRTYAMRKALQATHRLRPKTFELKAVPVSPFAGLRPGMSVIITRK